MAKTRTQIKTAVDNNTGRGTEKATLIETLCDEALKVALIEHPFTEARDGPTTFALAEDDESEDISSVGAIVDLLGCRILQTSGTLNAPLVMKEQTWWDRYVTNANDNQQGWPRYGYYKNRTVYFERPCQSGLTLSVRYTIEQTFAADATECPIAILDTFVVQYVTAFVFLSIEDTDKHYQWLRKALGTKWDEGVVGGSLLHAINRDKKPRAVEMQASRKGDNDRTDGLAVSNLITDHSRYGEVDTWY